MKIGVDWRGLGIVRFFFRFQFPISNPVVGLVKLV
jgi:hypothetical protein